MTAPPAAGIRGVVAVVLAFALGACPRAPEPTGPTPSPTAEGTPGATAEEPPEATPTPTSRQPPTPVPVDVRVVAAGLEAPWEVAFGGGRVFVSERDAGTVREVDPATGGHTVVQRFDVDASGEGGLLGLAASPVDDGLLYAYFTAGADNRVVRFRPAGDAERGEPGSAGAGPRPGQIDVILEGIPKSRFHNGGRIAFGPDGMLYVATGDAQGQTRAQDPGSLAGKILRLNPDGSVPADNPGAGSPVYALGLRNPQGLAWAHDGTLYASEFGPNADDEINRIRPGGNYGWPHVTGAAGRAGFLDPVFVRQPPEASWSGLGVLVGGAVPQWEGNLFAAALRGQRLWRLVLDDAGGVTGHEELFAGEYGRLRLARQAPDGSLWLLTSNRDGRGRPAAEDDRILRVGPAP